MLRNIILDRIEALKIVTDDFNKNSFRWKNFYIPSGRMHISEVDYRGLSDTNLAKIFERIIRQYYKQG